MEMQRHVSLLPLLSVIFGKWKGACPGRLALMHYDSAQVVQRLAKRCSYRCRFMRLKNNHKPHLKLTATSDLSHALCFPCCSLQIRLLVYEIGVYQSCQYVDDVRSIDKAIGMRQELTDMSLELKKDGPLHQLPVSAPGFSKAHSVLLALVQQCCKSKSRIIACAPGSASSTASGTASGPTSQAEAAASTFSQELELIIEKVLLWAQALHRPNVATHSSEGAGAKF